MSKAKKIKIDVFMAYRLIISNLRYGYTRNNHLMPSCAFDEAEELIESMSKADSEMAKHTAKQACEECISELTRRFPDGVDDEFGNMGEYREFAEWCLSKSGGEKPYNIESYLKHLSLDGIRRYAVKTKNEDGSESIDGPFTLEEAIDKVFEGLTEATYTKERMEKNGSVSYAYRLISPVDREALIEPIDASKTS